MKWDCIICKKNIHHYSYSVPCQRCTEYAHIKCADVSKTAKNVEWICLYCFRPVVPRVSPNSASLVGPGELQEQAGCERGREPSQGIAGDVRPNFQNPVNPQSQQTPEQSFWAALEKPEDLLSYLPRNRSLEAKLHENQQMQSRQLFYQRTKRRP